VITFLLNQQEHVVENIDPNTTVLDYLREHLQKTGSKEGCASGDCGACTVVIGHAGNVGIEYSAINACITLLGSLHGKQLITIEDLKDGECLHPVQQAMVDCHGSQCGFCTPGFVMSMFAYRKNNEQADRQSIIEALGGNLCRCTGYRPIVDAAVQMFEPPLRDQFDQTELAVLASLNAINEADGAVKLTGNSKHFFSPSTVKELADLLLEYPEARLVAGGTDLSLEITQFLRSFDCLIYIGRIEEMKTVVQMDDELDIGAAASYGSTKDALVALYPDLHELIDRLGSKQIRNQGTIGGNVGNASPIGDMPPVLIALGAKLVLRKGDVSRVIGIENYFVSYKKTSLETSEFIERIIVPKPQADSVFRVYKISKRLEDDISSSCGAFNINIVAGKVKKATIAFGGMAEIPKRASHCEQALIGKNWTDVTIAEAMDAMDKDFTPISDFRSSATYRLSSSRNLLRRLYLDYEQGEKSDREPSSNLLRVTQYA